MFNINCYKITQEIKIDILKVKIFPKIKKSKNNILGVPAKKSGRVFTTRFLNLRKANLKELKHTVQPLTQIELRITQFHS